MRRLGTKAGREAAQSASIEYAIKAGYTLETYKGLKILLRDKDDLIMLKVYKDNAAHEIIFCRYRTAEQRATAISNLKANYDRQTERKEEAKKNKSKSSTATASSQIKTELNQHFTGIKFSVTSSIFSGGDSVHIEWTNGPTTNEVEAITNKYQYGSFNGMEDIYEYTNRRADISQAKYVQTRRETSEELKSVLEAFKTSLENDENNQWNDNNYLPYKIFNKCSILPDATNFKIVRNEDITSGYAEDFYKITFDAPQQEAKKETAAPNFEAIEVKAGEVQIIDYSEKAIAVIGDTKPLKEQFKNMGGRFNFRLSCGAGWIFPKTKIQEVQNLLSGSTEEAPEEVKTDLKDEIQKTVQFFADSDVRIYGEVTESTKQAAKVQEVEIIEAQVISRPEYKAKVRELKFMALVDNAVIYEEEPKQRTTLKSITAAANRGEQISLFNLSQLI